jgi:hypothetical protein
MEAGMPYPQSAEAVSLRAPISDGVIKKNTQSQLSTNEVALFSCGKPANPHASFTPEELEGAAECIHVEY